MWKAIHGAVVVTMLAAVWLAAACGPSSNCEEIGTCPPDGGGGGSGTTPRCVPSENTDAVGDTCGVFVAKSGNDGSAGTKAEPVKTLEEAITRAAEKGTAVYACAEEFAEAAEVPAGVGIFGGLDCANGWRWIGETKKTIVAPGVEAIPLKLASGEGTTRIEDVAAHAADAQAPGASSIAVFVDGAKAELTRCELVAGNGAAGAEGEAAPSEAPMQAPSGNKGTDACSDLDGMGGPDATLSGGAQVVNECDGGQLSIGGKGGDGNKDNGGGGDDGAPPVADKGEGGKGEIVAGWDCSADGVNGGGAVGANGMSGDAGLAASGLGTLSSSGYAGASGGAGTTGKPGQGGGGGGGAKAGTVCGAAGAGASGGSGGAGGCGGLPGKGGGAGGASIALASVQATVTLKDCTLIAGSGGKGGAGGDVQRGGAGGNGGVGGTGVGVSNNACDGGKGGQGGNGGPGGGGLGGPSLGIAFRGTPVMQQGKTTLTPGAAGVGGPGGSNNAGMNAGAEGVAAASQELP